MVTNYRLLMLSTLVLDVPTSMARLCDLILQPGAGLSEMPVYIVVVGMIQLLLHIAAYWGLFMLRYWAPTIAGVETALGFILAISCEPYVSPQIMNVADCVAWCLWGMILTMPFNKALSEEFKHS